MTYDARVCFSGGGGALCDVRKECKAVIGVVWRNVVCESDIRKDRPFEYSVVKRFVLSQRTKRGV